MIKNKAYESVTEKEPVVLELCVSVDTCIKYAMEIFSGKCEIYSFIPKHEMYVEKSFKEIASELMKTLDELCRKHDELILKLLTEKDGKSAVLYICDASREIILEITYDLFTGKPGRVIREPESEDSLQAVFKKILETCEKFNKLRG